MTVTATTSSTEAEPTRTGTTARGSATSASDLIMSLEDMVSFKLSLLTKLLERRLARLVGGQFGLSVAEYRVLAQVIMRPGSTVRAIAARTLVDKAQVSRAVATLEEQALITRSVPNRDRRSPIVEPTRSGRALLRKIAPLRLAQEEEVIAQLDPDSVEEFRRCLTTLFDAFVEPSDDVPARLSLSSARQSEQLDKGTRARSERYHR